MNYNYKVFLSFAGEDRALVEQIAVLLRNNNISVFYDYFETDALWGKELFEHFSNLIELECEHVMIFISKAYKEKLWAIQEFKTALNRNIKEKGDFILPVKLDETELPGLHSSLGHLDARKFSAEDICDIFINKLSKKYKTTAKSLFEGLPNKVRSSFNNNADLRVYRLSDERHSSDFSGMAASLYGGRWNKVGDNVIYAGSSVASCLIEYLAAKTKFGISNSKLHLTTLRIPSSLNVEMIYEQSLKKDYKIDLNYSQTIGNIWLNKTESCILSLPSVVVASERIYLLNPKHTQFSKIYIESIVPFEIDNRLLLS